MNNNNQERTKKYLENFNREKTIKYLNSYIKKCIVKKISSALEQELQVAILKKAVIYEKEYNKGKKKFKRSEIN